MVKDGERDFCLNASFQVDDHLWFTCKPAPKKPSRLPKEPSSQQRDQLTKPSEKICWLAYPTFEHFRRGPGVLMELISRYLRFASNFLLKQKKTSKKIIFLRSNN